jgi:hypothetical protein
LKTSLNDDVEKMVDNILYRSDYDPRFEDQNDPRDVYGIYDRKIEPPTAPTKSALYHPKKWEKRQALIEKFDKDWPKFQTIIDKSYSLIPQDSAKPSSEMAGDGLRMVYSPRRDEKVEPDDWWKHLEDYRKNEAKENEPWTLEDYREEIKMFMFHLVRDSGHILTKVQCTHLCAAASVVCLGKEIKPIARVFGISKNTLKTWIGWFTKFREAHEALYQ